MFNFIENGTFNIDGWEERIEDVGYDIEWTGNLQTD